MNTLRGIPQPARRIERMHFMAWRVAFHEEILDISILRPSTEWAADALRLLELGAVK